jgi:hypothetical protein
VIDEGHNTKKKKRSFFSSIAGIMLVNLFFFPLSLCQQPVPMILFVREDVAKETIEGARIKELGKIGEN